MPNHWHFVVLPERDGDLPAFMQQVTNTHVKRWKAHCHEIGFGHLYQGRYKCFPVETEDYFYQVVRYVERNALRANLVERAESWRWSSLRRVERGARRPGVSHPLDVAFASPHRLAATCQPTANGSRSGGVALLRQSRSALRRSSLGHGRGKAIGARMHGSAPWKTVREASPRVAHAERRRAGVCSLTRGNLAARYADCARLVDQSGKKAGKSLRIRSAARFTRG